MRKTILVILFILSSCSTPYQKNGFRGGFSEQRLASDIFQVEFKGNGYTGFATVQNYLLKRCAEIAHENGYTHFIMSGRNAHTDQLHFLNKRFDNYVIDTTTRHQGFAVIKLINNPPADVMAYEAEYISPQRKPSSEKVYPKSKTFMEWLKGK
jgi:hypothetical protein